jgi:hypothetical protein
MTIDELRSLMLLIENHGFTLILLIAVLVWIVYPILQRGLKPHPDVHTLEQAIEIEKTIVSVLAQIADEFGAQWSVLWQFHNGAVSVAKVPFVFMSVTHEYSAAGMLPRGPMYKGIPISVFASAVAAIVEKGHLVVTLKSPFQAIVSSYKRDGVKSGVFTRIRSSKGALMGVLSISYSKNRRYPTEKEIADLQVYAARLASLLEQLVSEYRPHRRIGDDIV